MTKNKIKIITTGSSEMNFKNYLIKNFKEKNIYSNYSVINVTNKITLEKELLTANAIITSRWPNKKIKAPNLKVILTPGAGYDNIHFPSVPKGCKVCNVFEHETPIAEYCMLAMLESEINLYKMDYRLKKGNWSGYFSSSAFHGELLNKKLGILGYGHIGKEVAKRAKAFGMNITSIVRNTKKYNNISKNIKIISIKNIKRNINNFDYLIITCPLTNETKNLISLDLIKKMSKNSIIINIARGPIINEKALYIALKQKIIRGAIIDVWYQYPKNNNINKLWPSKFPLHKLDNIKMSAHMSAWTEELWKRRFNIMTQNLENLRNKKKLINIVNKK
tara:strand:- start:26488 stop:27489 length:1002 start_codon:yes stop_codon:yes gene_type:complete